MKEFRIRLFDKDNDGSITKEELGTVFVGTVRPGGIVARDVDGKEIESLLTWNI